MTRRGEDDIGARHKLKCQGRKKQILAKKIMVSMMRSNTTQHDKTVHDTTLGVKAQKLQKNTQSCKPILEKIGGFAAIKTTPPPCESISLGDPMSC